MKLLIAICEHTVIAANGDPTGEHKKACKECPINHAYHLKPSGGFPMVCMSPALPEAQAFLNDPAYQYTIECGNHLYDNSTAGRAA